MDSPISRVGDYLQKRNRRTKWTTAQETTKVRKPQKLAAALGVTQVIGCEGGDVPGTAMDLPPGTELHRGQVDVLQVPGTGIANEIS